PDPADGRSSQILLTEAARTRLPQACATLFEGNRDALNGFTEKEATQLVVLLTRLIANLDLAASVEE
ncbi:MAG TPA: MarR family transcriptional regulator, partial [Burkholderiales bacterium]